MDVASPWWKSFPLFRDLPDREGVTFFSRYPGSRKTYEPGQFVFLSGDELTQFVLLTKGRAVSHVPAASGEGVMAAYFDAPDYLAPGIAFSSNPRAPVEVRTLTKAETHAWPIEEIVAFCGQSPSFLKGLLGLLGDRIQFLASKVSGMRKLALRTRIVRYLLALPRTAECTVELPLSKQALSEYFAVARPSFSRALKELVDEGWIRFDRRVVRWSSDEDLERAASAD